MEDSTKKICSSCKKEKLLHEFTLLTKRLKSGSPVRSSWCKQCFREYRQRKRPHTIIMQLVSISQEDYEAAFIRQGGVCALCKRSEEPHLDTGRSLIVDHDHTTNKFRGLLCNSCNIRLGRIEKNKQFYLDALAYLDNL